MKVINYIRTKKLFILSVLVVWAIVLFFSYARYDKADFIRIPYYTWVTFAVYLSMLIFWGLSIRDRIIDRDMRINTLFIVVFLGLFLLIRSVKWEVSGNYSLEQFLWYLYYVPIIVVSYLTLIVILSSNKKLLSKYKKEIKVMGFAGIIIIVFILTNGLHFQVFRIIEWTEKYDVVERRWGYLLVYFWLLINFILVVVLLIKNSKLENTRKRLLAPIGVVAFYAIYAVLYNIDDSFKGVGAVEFTVMFCLIAVSFIESLIQVGLMPSNQNYIQIFENMDMPIMILDEEYDVISTSKIGTGVSKDVYSRLDDGEHLEVQGNRVCIKGIKGGHVLWIDDMSEINKSLKEIKKANIEMGIRNEVLKEEIRLSKREIATREKERIYTVIEGEIVGKRKEINELIEEIEPENERFMLTKICLIGAYIKRISNIILLEEIYGYVNALELENAILESLLNYRIKNEAICDDKFVDFKLSGMMVKSIYSCFSRELERSLDKDTKVEVSWGINDDKFVLRICFIGAASELKGLFSCLDDWNDIGQDVLREHGGNFEKISISLPRYI